MIPAETYTALLLICFIDEFCLHGKVLFWARHGRGSSIHSRTQLLIFMQNLKRIEVIADDEGEIVEAVKRMSNNYDFVVTSGGIGPTYVLVSCL